MEQALTMDLKLIGGLGSAAVLVAACQQAQPSAPREQHATAAPAEAESLPPQKPSRAADSADAVSATAQLTAEAERGETGARDVLLSFARAIELRHLDEAWSLLSPADRQKWSKAAFAAMFADLGKTMVAVPTGTMEGATGSSYYTAPISVTGTDRDGRPVRIEGQAVLRRVNDVDGASSEERRWHFETLKLDWTH